MAPILVFAYNRLECFTQLIQSLKSNSLSIDSDLFIFIDGPKDEIDRIKVESVLNFAKHIDGFKTIEIRFESINKGLANSIISGVSSILKKYESVIVLEDDLILSSSFLQFMNIALNKYSENKNIISVCGYSNCVNFSGDYLYDAYFAPRSSSWGWGTWASRWCDMLWDVDIIKKQLYTKNARSLFNKWGGSDCSSMLESCLNGTNNSWAIRFTFNQFLNDQVSLFPCKSLVLNDGFVNEGTNCRGYSRFKSDFNDNYIFEFNLPNEVSIDKNIVKQALSYHSIKKRIYTKIINYIYYKK